nr:roadblock/LC7 domain-containing protein [Streptomyces brasiliscabiei]
MTGTGFGTSADDRLTWLMEGLLERTPGARHALVLSRDGLRLCRTPELSVDRADQLAAIAAGIQSLSHGASLEFGDGSGGVRSAMAEFHGGVLLIVEAGEGAHLAVVTDEEADAGLVGHNMSELVEQLGEHLSARPRRPTDPEDLATDTATAMATGANTATTTTTTAVTALAPRTS